MRFLKIFLCIFLFFTVGATTGDEAKEEEDGLYEDMLNLHKSDSGRYMIWHECGKRVKDKELRAQEYTKAILASIDNVYQETGIRIDPRIPRAILFRESSDNECSIGKQEIGWLTENLGRAPAKEEVIKHVRKWREAYRSARKSCQRRKTYTPTCVKDHVRNHNGHYLGIKGWDIGGPQFRWPTRALEKRVVVTPAGKTFKGIGLKELMDYEIAVQMLIEDLADHYVYCKANHKHAIHSKWGFKVRDLETGESYYAHHHVGKFRWSEKYYDRIQGHFRRMDKMKSISSEKLMASTR